MDPVTLLLLAGLGYLAWSSGAGSNVLASIMPDPAKPPGSSALGQQPAKAVIGSPTEPPDARIITRPQFLPGTAQAQSTGHPTQDAVSLLAVKEAPTILEGLAKALSSAFSSIAPGLGEPVQQVSLIGDPAQYTNQVGTNVYGNAMAGYLAGSGGDQYAVSQDLGIDQAGGQVTGVSSQLTGSAVTDGQVPQQALQDWWSTGQIPEDRPYAADGSIGLDQSASSIESGSYSDLGVDNMPGYALAGAGAAAAFGASPGGDFTGFELGDATRPDDALADPYGDY